MGWQDFYARRDALNAAIEQGELRRSDAFPDERELLLALHHRWAQRLTARVELAELTDADPVDAVGAAWRRTAEDNPALRALLDEHAANPSLSALVNAEHRTLARAAGLTEPADSPEEEAQIGAAFTALQRTTPPTPASPPFRTRESPVQNPRVARSGLASWRFGSIVDGSERPTQGSRDGDSRVLRRGLAGSEAGTREGVWG